MTSETDPNRVDRDALIAFLRRPEAYPHAPDGVQEIQTHISWVFIAQPYVYKVKKPVSLGFLDFSTLEKRRHFCEQEVRLNRRLCAPIYEGVVPVSRTTAGFALEDDSDVVEVAVKMRRLAGGEFADELVRQGSLERSHIDRIVQTLERFYRSETPSVETAVWGRIDRLKISTDENFEQTRRYAGSLLSEAAFEAIRFYTNRFFDVHTRMLNERRASGRILDCHGDLHLEHVYLTPETVCIYDCIEFNERLRSIDVASDAAFLAMDLDFNDRPALSRYFITQMARAMEDPELLRLADFYKCYRAYVRAKVESMRSDEGEVPGEEREKSRKRAVRYYRLALRYAAAGSSPLVLIIMGRVGTGKSTVARELSEALGWPVVSSDRTRKEKAGVGLFDRGNPEERRALYSRPRTEEAYEVLREQAVTSGTSVIVDATYSKRAHRDDLRRALEENEIPYCFVEMTAADETVRDRLASRDGGEETISDARLEDFGMLSGGYDPPDDLEDTFHVRISSERPLSDTIREILTEVIRLDLGGS